MEPNLVKRGLDRLILLPIVLSVVYAGILLWQLNRMTGQNEWVQHTTDVLSTSGDAQRHIQAQESMLRGYLLTHNVYFTGQYQREDSVIDNVFQRLHQLALDNEQQTQRIDTLLQTYWTWQASAKHGLMLGANNIQDTSILTRARITETMRSLFERINQEERLLYDHRLNRLRTGMSWLTVSIAALSIILGIIVGLNTRRQTKRFVDRFTHTIEESNRNKDLLETTLLSIGDAIIVTGADRRITLMNRRAEELTGWSLEEARDKPSGEIFRIVDELSHTPIESPITGVLRERRTVELANHAMLLSRSGVDYPVEDSAAPIQNSRGEIVGVVLVFRDVSQRRQDQYEADQREREFRALIENSPDVVTRYNRDFTISYANPAIEHIHGIPPQAIIGKRYKDLGVPEEIYTLREREIEEVFSTGRSITTEVQFQTVRGLKYFHSRIVPEIDNRGVVSVIAIARDVTEMKVTETRLRESEQRFRGIVESSPDAFYLLRAVREGKKDDRNAPKEIVDFVFEYINAHGAELITLPIEEIRGKRLSETFTGERAKQFLSRYAEVIQRGIPTTEDYRVQSAFVKDAKWLHSQYVPIGDMLAITTSDITPRMQFDRALRKSEQRYRRLVENASEVIFSTDKEGRFTYANPYVRELGGFGDDDVSQYVFTDLVAPMYRDRIKRHFYRQFLSRTQDSFIEAPFMTRSGEEKWLSITTSLRLHGEDVEGFDCIASDITARIRIESELREARNHEEGRVTEELDHLSEQLREPLQTILDSSQSLAEQLAGTKAYDTARQIARQAESALRAIPSQRLGK